MPQDESSVQFDRTYWPPSGTIINAAFPNDLNDLWETHEEQASVFVAEALISDPPRHALRSDGDALHVETFVWTVGGDTLTVQTNLDNLMTQLDSDYNICRSPDQADELETMIDALERLEKTISTTKGNIRKLLTDWQKRDE